MMSFSQASASKSRSSACLHLQDRQLVTHIVRLHLHGLHRVEGVEEGDTGAISAVAGPTLVVAVATIAGGVVGTAAAVAAHICSS